MISIIVPAHNEEDNICDAVKQIEVLITIPHELLVVNDHSTDQTRNLVCGLCATYPNLVLVENQLPNGFANALKSGFASARGEIVVPVMADLCDDLSTIGKLFEKINQGYDIVCGSRYMSQGARIGGSKFKAALSSFAGCSLYHLLGIPTHDIANAFKMCKKSVLQNIDIRARGFEISMEITLKAYYLGYKISETPTIWKERTKGKSNFRIFKLLPDYIKLYIWAFYKRLVQIMKG